MAYIVNIQSTLINVLQYQLLLLIQHLVILVDLVHNYIVLTFVCHSSLIIEFCRVVQMHPPPPSPTALSCGHIANYHNPSILSPLFCNVIMIINCWVTAKQHLGFLSIILKECEWQMYRGVQSTPPIVWINTQH